MMGQKRDAERALETGADSSLADTAGSEEYDRSESTVTSTSETGAWSSGWTRRRLLGSIVGVSALRVGYELVGFGTVTGTNVTEQPVGEYARESLEPTPFDLSFENHRLVFDGRSVDVRTDTGDRRTRVPIVDTAPEAVDVRGVGAGLRRELRTLAADLAAITAGAVPVDAVGTDQFFERARNATPRPLTVAALRGTGFRQPDLEAIERFAGVDPHDTAALVGGLADGFGEHTHFDVSRYLAGNVQEHLLFESVGIRQSLEGPETFEGLSAGDVGLYCWEYTLRSIEAFHAVSPPRQSIPVFCGTVRDRRHNHMYTALATVVHEGGTRRLLLTFVDYSHAAMYENVGLQFVLGAGVDAYDERHRVSDLYY
jgi:hypothetical protein